MRRAIVLAALVGSAHGVAADPWVVTGEAGTELDSNVQRVQDGAVDPDDPLETVDPVTAWVMRFGARVERRGKIAGGAAAFNLSDLTRIVTDGEIAVENVSVLAGNLRWLRRVGERPVAAGFAVAAIDALPLSDNIGARTFRNLGADAVLAMQTEDEHELTLAFGVRDFTYKPDHDFDWRGPAANARLELMLWQPAAKTKALELVTTLAFENRGFDTTALANDCPHEAEPDPGCSASTDIQRRDRYQRLGVELTWVGRQVAAIAYQITVIDSNDYGQSLARHRATLSGTAVLPLDVYGTLLAILQIDQYLEGRIVPGGPQMQEYTSIDDENRSSVQLRLARKLVGQWAIEGRAAIWRNLSNEPMEAEFGRELVYLGLVYGK
ncbi:MAG TPA: hypothetical protein VIV11_37185 [Kofleriaceae bacterium]